MFRSCACIAVVLTAGFFSRGNPQAYFQEAQGIPESYDEQEAYRVYEAVLPLDQLGREDKTLVIRAETEPYKVSCLKPEKEWQELLEPAIADYQKVNSKSWLLQRHLEISKPYEIVSQDEITAILRESPGLGEEWRIFDKRYRGSSGWIELSAVGFNADKSVALVYISHECGNLCAGGEFHVLQKQHDKWKPIKWVGQTCLWMS